MHEHTHLSAGPRALASPTHHAQLRSAVKDGHNVGMLQPSRSPSLPDEPVEGSPIPMRIELLHFDSHVPAEHRVMRRPDMTHPARPDPPVQPIPPHQQDLRVHTRHPTPPGVPYLDGGREGGLRHCAALSADGLGYASCPRIVPVGDAVVWTLT